jgi:N6-L-threonylcarbamoyladenine synthase
VKDYFDMEIIGKTIDDAAGEAFDKIGKYLTWIILQVLSSTD